MENRIEVKLGDDILSIVPEQLEHWESLGYEQVKTTNRRSKAGDQ